MVAFAVYSLYCRLRYRPYNVKIPMHGAWWWGPLRNLPGMIQLFLVVIKEKVLLDWSVSQHEQHGNAVAFKFLFGPWWIATTNPENVQHILSLNFPNYRKGLWMSGKLHELLGKGIFNVDGKDPVVFKDSFFCCSRLPSPGRSRGGS